MIYLAPKVIECVGESGKIFCQQTLDLAVRKSLAQQDWLLHFVALLGNSRLVWRLSSKIMIFLYASCQAFVFHVEFLW